MTTTPEILGIGEPLIEMVRLPDPVDGRPAYVQGFGGDTSTVMIAAARQGGRAGYLTGISDDMFGADLRALWTREGVDVSTCPVKPGSPTGICFIDPDPQARRFAYARTGSAASLYGPEDLPEAAIARAKVLHLSGITLAISATMRAAAFRAIEVMKAAGGRVSLDLNYRPALWRDEPLAREVMTAAAERADIVFPSDDEAQALFGLTEPETVASFFLGRGAELVLVKRGAQGAWMQDRRGGQPIPPAPSTPVDSTGAGDSFAGAFLAWYLETGDAALAAGKAAEVAAATVGGFGAVEPIPRRPAQPA